MPSKRFQWSLFTLLAIVAVIAAVVGVFSHFWRRTSLPPAFTWEDAVTVRDASVVEVYRLDPPFVDAEGTPLTFDQKPPLAGPFPFSAASAERIKKVVLDESSYEVADGALSYAPGAADLQLKFLNGGNVVSVYLSGDIVEIHHGQKWVGLDILTNQAHAALLKIIEEVAPETSEVVPPPD